MDDGRPSMFCEDFNNSMGLVGHDASSQTGGLMGFLRHQFTSHHPDDIEHGRLSCSERFQYQDGMKSNPSTSTLPSYNDDARSSGSTTASGVVGRSFTWANFRSQSLSLDSHLSGPPSIAEAGDSPMSSSQSYHILPGLASFAPPLSHGEKHATEKPTFIIGDKSGVDAHSFFGLPSRIKVTKRELNMMTPSSF